MSKKIVIRRMGQTMKEGTIVRWLAEDGAQIRAGSPVYELEYDKASVEVEAPCDGILHIIAEEGATLPVGETIAEVLEAGETPAASPANKLESVNAEAGPASAEAYGISASAKRMLRQNGVDATLIVPANGRRIMPQDVTAYLNGAKQSTQINAKASPLAKKLAADLDLEISSISAKGRVLAEDILKYVSEKRCISE